jgi:hypothetical protein
MTEPVQQPETKVFYHRKRRTFRLQKSTDEVVPDVRQAVEPDMEDFKKTAKLPAYDAADTEGVIDDDTVDDDFAEPLVAASTGCGSGDTVLPGVPVDENGEVECFAVEKKLNDTPDSTKYNASLLTKLRGKLNGLRADTKNALDEVLKTASSSLSDHRAR